MTDIILETLIDTLKLLPFLFVAFLIMEYIEHKLQKNGKEKIKKSGKYGPILGSILGAVPQCGFSVMATNLYATRIISLGTLISIYLSTSDEMLPILISNGTKLQVIVSIILMKVIIGLISGLVIDFIFNRKYKVSEVNEEIHEICHDDNCHCEDGIIKSALKHTVSIIFFILIANLLINLVIHYIGEDKISEFMLQKNYFSYFLSSLIGLIPNCASSVIITELYLNEMISLGNMLSGVLTGSGLGILVLFRTNKNLKENLLILALIYFIGVFSGLLIDLLGVVL